MNSSDHTGQEDSNMTSHHDKKTNGKVIQDVVENLLNDVENKYAQEGDGQEHLLKPIGNRNSVLEEKFGGTNGRETSKKSDMEGLEKNGRQMEGTRDVEMAKNETVDGNEPMERHFLVEAEREHAEMEKTTKLLQQEMELEHKKHMDMDYHYQVNARHLRYLLEKVRLGIPYKTKTIPMPWSTPRRKNTRLSRVYRFHEKTDHMIRIFGRCKKTGRMMRFVQRRGHFGEYEREVKYLIRSDSDTQMRRDLFEVVSSPEENVIDPDQDVVAEIVGTSEKEDGKLTDSEDGLEEGEIRDSEDGLEEGELRDSEDGLEEGELRDSEDGLEEGEVRDSEDDDISDIIMNKKNPQREMTGTTTPPTHDESMLPVLKPVDPPRRSARLLKKSETVAPAKIVRSSAKRIQKAKKSTPRAVTTRKPKSSNMQLVPAITSVVPASTTVQLRRSERVKDGPPPMYRINLRNRLSFPPWLLANQLARFSSAPPTLPKDLISGHQDVRSQRTNMLIPIMAPGEEVKKAVPNNPKKKRSTKWTTAARRSRGTAVARVAETSSPQNSPTMEPEPSTSAPGAKKKKTEKKKTDRKKSRSTKSTTAARRSRGTALARVAETSTLQARPTMEPEPSTSAPGAKKKKADRKKTTVENKKQEKVVVKKVTRGKKTDKKPTKPEKKDD